MEKKITKIKRPHLYQVQGAMYLMGLLELLVCVMTDYCQFSFKLRFKNYHEVTDLAYYVLSILR